MLRTRSDVTIKPAVVPAIEDALSPCHYSSDAHGRRACLRARLDEPHHAVRTRAWDRRHELLGHLGFEGMGQRVTHPIGELTKHRRIYVTMAVAQPQSP